ncbi:hypothetical protein KBC79_00020 [Candidatus Woesebacteria bacterium]|nr:hypothetical protein [Candidatus Woesebacteria bacterium]
MTKNQDPLLFVNQNTSSKVFLTYFTPDSAIKADDLGQAIIGMRQCLRKAAIEAHLDFDDVFVLPVEEGSVKTIFIFIKNEINQVKKDKITVFTVVVGIDIVANLLVNSLQLIKEFGADQVKHPNSEIAQAVSDPRVLSLCQDVNFRKGAQDIASPLSEVNKKAKITVSDKEFTIECDQKYQFYENDNEKILPELVDGTVVTLKGEVTRINKKYNDIGFSYNGKTISVVPENTDESVVEFHEALKKDEIYLTGRVQRSSEYEAPKIILHSVSDVETQPEFNFLSND